MPSSANASTSTPTRACCRMRAMVAACMARRRSSPASSHSECQRKEVGLRFSLLAFGARKRDQPRCALLAPLRRVEQRDALELVALAGVPALRGDELRKDVALELCAHLFRQRDSPRHDAVAEQALPPVEQHQHRKLVARRALLAMRRQLLALGQPEPDEAVTRQRQQVGRFADRRKRRAAHELDRHAPLVPREIELDRLRASARDWPRRG